MGIEVVDTQDKSAAISLFHVNKVVAQSVMSWKVQKWTDDNLPMSQSLSQWIQYLSMLRNMAHDTDEAIETTVENSTSFLFLMHLEALVNNGLIEWLNYSRNLSFTSASQYEWPQWHLMTDFLPSFVLMSMTIALVDE
jgi:hypothetical protein